MDSTWFNKTYNTHNSYKTENHNKNIKPQNYSTWFTTAIFNYKYGLNSKITS